MFFFLVGLAVPFLRRDDLRARAPRDLDPLVDEPPERRALPRLPHPTAARVAVRAGMNSVFAPPPHSPNRKTLNVVPYFANPHVVNLVSTLSNNFLVQGIQGTCSRSIFIASGMSTGSHLPRAPEAPRHDSVVITTTWTTGPRLPSNPPLHPVPYPTSPKHKVVFVVPFSCWSMSC